MNEVEVLGRVGGSPGRPTLLLLYTGGTIGMGHAADGTLVPLDLREIVIHVPFLRRLPVGLTLATFTQPIDSAAVTPSDWIVLADAIVGLAPGHAGVVVLHGTDTMAYTASALSFLLDGVEAPIVLTGAQRPVTELRSDGRENLVTALEIAAGDVRGAGPHPPEVMVFFDDVLLRGNRTTKIHADGYHGFDSPNHLPLARAGLSIEWTPGVVTAPRGTGPLRRGGGLSEDVAALRLFPGLGEAALRAVLGQPGLRGVVLEAFGAGNGPPSSWFTGAIREAIDRGVIVVVTTQCHAGSVVPGIYATGSALFSAGAVSGGDMTFEAALTKLMVLLDRYDADAVRGLMTQDLAGELTRR